MTAQKLSFLGDHKNCGSCLIKSIFGMHLSSRHDLVQKIYDCILYNKALQCLFCMTFPIIKLNVLISALFPDLTNCFKFFFKMSNSEILHWTVPMKQALYHQHLPVHFIAHFRNLAPELWECKNVPSLLHQMYLAWAWKSFEELLSCVKQGELVQNPGCSGFSSTWRCVALQSVPMSASRAGRQRETLLQPCE